MSGSSTALWIICVAGTLAIVAAVVIPRLASRRPHHANPQRGQMRGVVQGGGEPPPIDEEVAAHENRAARGNQPGREHGSPGSPMDL